MGTRVINNVGHGGQTVGRLAAQTEKVQINIAKQDFIQIDHEVIPNLLLESFKASFLLSTHESSDQQEQCPSSPSSLTAGVRLEFDNPEAHLERRSSPLGMERNGIEIKSENREMEVPLIWDWDVEQKDRQREAKMDASLHGAIPFEVDRKVLKDVVREKMGIEVGRIVFISSGTFHKAYFVTLTNKVQVVARVARRFMPRLKTESEVATLRYLRERTNVPVPTVLHHDSNPFNRLGGEYILMTKAEGVPLSKFYHSMPYIDLVKLLQNVAKIIIPLFSHRFSSLGSLYLGPDPSASTSAVPTPKAIQTHYTAFPFSSTLGMTTMPSRLSTSSSTPTTATPDPLSRVPSTSGCVTTNPAEFHIGPIISWPFFGSNRGELSHLNEINRGPWSTSKAYFDSCVEREVKGVIRENEGKTAPHKLHLDPDEINSSRHHHLEAVPDDQSDESDEWDLEESEDEWEGPGAAMYRDYRRMQRTTFLFTHLQEKEDCVKKEMARWLNLMDRLVKQQEELKSKEIHAHLHLGTPKETEEFGFDCHDLSLENIFVDEKDPTKITCIIDWESTTTRPLWQCAHLPAFLQSSPFTAKLFQEVLIKMASEASSTSVASVDTPKAGSFIKESLGSEFALLAQEWLFYDVAGMRLRMAHRLVEWDGWEEGLAESMLGTEEFEEDWFKEADIAQDSPPLSPLPDIDVDGGDAILTSERAHIVLNDNEVEVDSEGGNGSASSSSSEDGSVGRRSSTSSSGKGGDALPASLARRKVSSKIPVIARETEKENTLDTTGDICGGRGGELGRRLEAWLTVSGHNAVPEPEKSVDGPRRR